MSGLHEGRWAAFGGEPRDELAGGGAPPYVVCEGWWSVRPYRVPASRPRGAHPHRGGHAINGMHPPRPALSGQTNSPPTCPNLTPPNDAGHTAVARAGRRGAAPADTCRPHRAPVRPKRLAMEYRWLSIRPGTPNDRRPSCRTASAGPL